MLLGPIGHGKTTLIQRLNEETITYNKTQDVIYTGDFIDTPGEFVQHRHLNIAIQSTSQDASCLIFVLNTTVKDHIYSPGYAHSFNKPTIGVLTHIDVASEEELAFGENQLKMAGVSKVFKVSSISGEGVDELKEYLSEVMKCKFTQE